MPLSIAIRQVFALYRPGGRHGHRFWGKKSSCGVVKSLSKASNPKTQNGPSSQLTEATSCVERSFAMIKVEELHNFSGYQTLIMDTNK
jgi:hypothetical protein